MKIEQTEPLIHERDVARILAVSIAWLQRMRWKGGGPAYVKNGRAVRYEPSEIRRWIAENRIARKP